jgi:hypothetical protein
MLTQCVLTLNIKTVVIMRGAWHVICPTLVNNIAMNYNCQPHAFSAIEYAIVLMQTPYEDNNFDDGDNLADELNLNSPGEENDPNEGSWDDEDDEDFDDEMESRDDLNEIRTADDIGEPDPEDDDHLPDDDLQ